MGEIGLHAPLPDDVIVENIVDDFADILKDISPLHKGLVVLGGVGDLEIKSLAGIPFGIDSIECQRNLRVNIGTDGILRPGRINFTGADIFNVIRKRDIDIFRIGAGCSQMHYKLAGNDHALQHLRDRFLR